MAVVLAIGGAIIGGLILVDDSHSDYSDYDDDYEDYNDAEERKRRRIGALKEDAELAAGDLSSYKRDTVNPELVSDRLKAQTAMDVSASEMDKDAGRKIQTQIDAQVEEKAGRLKQELKDIDRLLLKIEEIEKGNEK